MHTLIVGTTCSGKSFLAKKLAAEFKRDGRTVAVLDPIANKWAADFQTHDPAVFLDYCRTHTGLIIFVDESGDVFEKYDSELNWLATRGRHLGHYCFFIGQRYTQIPKTVRANCSNLYLFASHPDDAAELAKDFNEPDLAMAATLPQGHFFFKRMFQVMLRGCINFARGVVDIAKRR